MGSLVLALAMACDVRARTPEVVTSAAACDDFYDHACGAWLASATIPAGADAIDSGHDVAAQATDRLLDAILTRTDAADPETARLRVFYASCMHPTSADDQLLASLLATVDRIETRTEAWAALRAHHRIGGNAFFVFSGQPDRSAQGRQRGELHQGTVRLPKEGQDRYRARVERMFVIAGVEPARAAADASHVVAIERRLAPHLLRFSDRFDAAISEHPQPLAALEAIVPGFPWADYLREAGYPSDRPVNVTSPAYLGALGEILRDAPPDALRAELRWALLDDLSAVLPARFSEAGAPAPDRHSTCRLETVRALGVELSRRFSTRFVGPAARARAAAAAERLRSTIADDVAATSWLSPTSRAGTLEKIRRTDLKIAYPDEWPRVGSFPLNDATFLANVIAARTYERRRTWDNATTPLRTAAWEMTVFPNAAPGMAAARLTIPNGFPDALSNSLIVTAAYLQPPLFDPAAPPEIHYATFGDYMGHELVHVIQTHEFDAEGRERELWTPADRAAHDALARCVVAEAEAAGLPGERMLEENVADFAGLAFAHRSLARDLGPRLEERGADGLTREQRFFYAFARNWCTKQTPAAAKAALESDPHAPARFRVNAPIANLPAFARAFGCKPGARMARPHACVVW